MPCRIGLPGPPDATTRGAATLSIEMLRMRIFLIVILAVVTGILLGSASTSSEFGYQSINPWHDFTATSFDTMFLDGHMIPASDTAAITLPKDGEPQPKARVDVLVQDFGEAERGERGEFTYVIYNDGDGPLELKKGRSSCKCTVGKISKSVVPPGESAHVLVQWKASGKKEKFFKSVTIKTNDRERSTIKFSVAGKVLPVVSFHPERISTFTLVAGEPSQAEAKLFGYRDEPLEVQSWRFNNAQIAKYFDVSYEPLDEKEVAERGAKSGILFRIEIKAGLPAGEHNQELSVVTNAKSRQLPRVSMYLPVHEAVSVFGTRVRSGWNWSSQSLTLRQAADSPYFAERIVIQAKGQDREQTEYKIKEVQPAELQVELGKRYPQRSKEAIWTDLHVSLPDEVDATAAFANLPKQTGYVVIETTNPKYPELRFDVDCRVSSSAKRRQPTDQQDSPTEPEKSAATASETGTEPTAATGAAGPSGERPTEAARPIEDAAQQAG